MVTVQGANKLIVFSLFALCNVLPGVIAANPTVRGTTFASMDDIIDTPPSPPPHCAELCKQDPASEVNCRNSCIDKGYDPTMLSATMLCYHKVPNVCGGETTSPNCGTGEACVEPEASRPNCGSSGPCDGVCVENKCSLPILYQYGASNPSDVLQSAATTLCHSIRGPGGKLQRPTKYRLAAAAVNTDLWKEPLTIFEGTNTHLLTSQPKLSWDISTLHGYSDNVRVKMGQGGSPSQVAGCCDQYCNDGVTLKFGCTAEVDDNYMACPYKPHGGVFPCQRPAAHPCPPNNTKDPHSANHYIPWPLQCPNCDAQCCDCNADENCKDQNGQTANCDPSAAWLQMPTPAVTNNGVGLTVTFCSSPPPPSPPPPSPPPP